MTLECTDSSPPSQRQQETIGFVGVGQMGLQMARILLHHGYV